MIKFRSNPRLAQMRWLQLFALLSVLSLCVGFQAAPQGTDIGPIIGLIMARALQLTTIVKLVVDGVLKGAFGAEGNKLIVSAIVLGILIDFAVLGISGGAASFTLQNCIMAVVAGTVAGVGSKALTSVHDAARETTQ